MELLDRIHHLAIPSPWEAWTTPDPDPDTSYLDQEDFKEHKAAFERGDFWHVGVILVRECAECGGTIYGPSVWGVETDGSDDGYMKHLALDLCAELEETNV